MATNIHKIIAAMRPEYYCEKSLTKEVQKTAKEEGYLKAAEKVKLIKSQYMDTEKVLLSKNLMDAPGMANPIEKHSLTYESMGTNLESVYFWILDKMTELYSGRTYKLIDNFIASPGSAHFAEMGQRAVRMQDEAMKILGGINQVIKSILNLIYDLRDFKLRLSDYDKLKSDDEEQKKAAVFSLKQIWMDTVDVKKGNTSLKGMAFGGQTPQFVTLIDAFMAAESLKQIGKLDLNERVKRILKQRYQEFETWVKESEKELRKRFELEKTYLRSQYNTVQIYSRWLKPYLNAAKSLEQSAQATSSLVNTFNTSLMELSIMGYKPFDPWEDLLQSGEMPQEFSEKALKEKFYQVIIVDFKFRSIPERTQQQGGGYTFKGTVDINFTSYALNDDEVEQLKKEVEKDSFGDVLESLGGLGEESLDKIKDDVEEFLSEDEEKEEEKKKSKDDDANPFTALFSFVPELIKAVKDIKESKKKDKKDLSNGMPKDSYIQKAIRSATAIAARDRCANIYGLYKKLNGMPTT